MGPIIAAALIVGDHEIVQEPKVPGSVAQRVALVNIEIPFVWLVDDVEMESGFLFRVE